MRSLQDILATDFALDLTGWTLEEATGISAAGLTIVGLGTNPNGGTEAWIATLPAPVCGNGIVEGGEQCDDGAANSDTAPDACRTDCTNPSCGDGVIDAKEECDDLNLADGDGCSSACVVEPGFACDSQPSICGPDCNENEIRDELDLAAGTSDDCNVSGVPDECEIASGASFDCNVNGIPDECESPDCPANLDRTSINGGGTASESSSGTYQLIASTAQSGGVGIVTSENYQLSDGFWFTTLVVTCPIETACPAGVQAIGPRYLAITPLPGETAVAIKVTSPDEPCVSLYVQAPETINGNVIGRLGANPVLLTPAEWGTVNVSDEAILPGTIYGVQTELADATLSGPSTATTWLWADANNSRGTIDFDDILCILEGFADNYAGACSFFGADLEGGVTNVTIDFDDILAALDAFAGDGYFDNPTHVDPCP